MKLTETEIKEICKRKPKCYCPEIYIVRGAVCDTPEFVRRYFMELGIKNLKQKNDKNFRTRHY